MKILYIMPLFYPAIGGAEFTFSDLTRKIRSAGNQVVVLTTRGLSARDFWDPFTRSKKSLKRLGSLDGVVIVRLNPLPIFTFALKFIKKLLYLIKLPVPDFIDRIANGPFLLGYDAQIKELLKLKLDLVHCSGFPFNTAHLARQLKEKSRLPLVLTPHFHYFDKDYHKPWLFRVLRSSDVVMARTLFAKAFFKKIKVNPANITIDVPPFSRDDRIPDVKESDMIAVREKVGQGRIILFLGRQVKYKNIDLLIKAFFKVKREENGVKLVLVGPKTDYSTALTRQIESTDLLNLGRVSEGEKWALLKLANMLVLPSLFEAFGMCFLEAWAMKTPVIGVRQGSARLIIKDGEDGLLFNDGDVNDLASKILYLLRNGNEAIEMGEKGNKKLDHYLWSKCIALHLDKYEEITTRKKMR
ncbi:MAG: glycosyltransferase family 4 protein [Promethearchaeota archaeon]